MFFTAYALSNLILLELRTEGQRIYMYQKIRNRTKKYKAEVKILAYPGWIFFIPVFHSPFSLKPLILWMRKMTASKLTTQTLTFDS